MFDKTKYDLTIKQLGPYPRGGRSQTSYKCIVLIVHVLLMAGIMVSHFS